MRKSRFSEEHIIGILKENQARIGAKELCRKHGVSMARFTSGVRGQLRAVVADHRKRRLTAPRVAA